MRALRRSDIIYSQKSLYYFIENMRRTALKWILELYLNKAYPSAFGKTFEPGWFLMLTWNKLMLIGSYKLCKIGKFRRRIQSILGRKLPFGRQQSLISLKITSGSTSPQSIIYYFKRAYTIQHPCQSSNKDSNNNRSKEGWFKLSKELSLYNMSSHTLKLVTSLGMLPLDNTLLIRKFIRN